MSAPSQARRRAVSDGRAGPSSIWHVCPARSWGVVAVQASAGNAVAGTLLLQSRFRGTARRGAAPPADRDLANQAIADRAEARPATRLPRPACAEDLVDQGAPAVTPP